MSRRRIFSFENTFWMFFSQVLDADGGCQEAVRKIQAYACRKSLSQPSSSTAAYCKARAKLQQENLQSIYQHTTQYLSTQAPSGHLNTTSFHIITTLLDARSYSAESLADLYYQRWQVELFFRDIKTSMGMDILRCKSPDMIHKETLMHFIVYNCKYGISNTV